MVHFDAHPDLACSKAAPAIAFFNPRHYCGNDRNNTEVKEDGKNLYELLDLEPSGIAEWILPLVLAANLKKIEWIKPYFSSQIAKGNYRFAVGVEHERLDGNGNEDKITSYLDLPESARVKVDFNHPYYLDDTSVTSIDRLVLEQNLELKVSELRSLPSEQNEKKKRVSCGREKSNTTRKERTKNLWTLDICLDYFVCQNPYISDLERRNSLVARAFLNVMESSRFNTYKTENNNDNIKSSMDYQTEIIRFYKLLEEILLENLDENIQTTKLAPDNSTFTTRTNVSFGEIQKYFQTPEEATRLIGQLIIEINDDNGDSAGLYSMVIESIPNWSMPHDTSSAATKKINESLLLVEAHILGHLEESNDPPFLVTIARSALDGFCPPQLVETLQCRVLDIICRQICGEGSQFSETDCSASRNGNGSSLLLVRDYGEWEGSVIPWKGTV